MSHLISGRSKLLVIIGDPLERARTPLLANELLDSHGRFGEFVLMPMHVANGNLRVILDALRQTQNFRGAVITMPHKIAVVDLLDEVTDEVRVVRAANVIRREASGRLIGTVLDGEGFVAGLKNFGHEIVGKTCLVLGAGGAASAIAFALLKHGCLSLTLLNRSTDKARNLAARLSGRFPAAVVQLGTTEPSRFDIVVNATSLGMNPDDPSPVDIEFLRHCAVAAECVVAQDITPFLQTAQAAGCQVHLGLPMLHGQMQLMLEFMGALESVG